MIGIEGMMIQMTPVMLTLEDQDETLHWYYGKLGVDVYAGEGIGKYRLNTTTCIFQC